MHTYSAREVEKILRLSRSTLRGLVEIGFITPARGSRREYRFSFQDLIVLRAARALIDAKVPRRRIRKSLEDLRKHLPEELPLSGLSITAIGDRVVVRDGDGHFQVDDGQYLLGFNVRVEDGTLRVVEHKPEPERSPSVEDELDALFDDAFELEAKDAKAAIKLYERIAERDPHNSAAWTNWGRLLHEQGELKKAETVYRRGLERCSGHAVLLFNLGVLLEDLERPEDALDIYQQAINDDPDLADCHYNLARLYELVGQPQHAIRHLGQYRRLVGRR